MLDRLITGARVFDGSRLRDSCNVGILGDAIAYVGSKTPAARLVTPAPGFVLSPAFIDTHNHGDFHCQDASNDGHSALSQGVGTLVVGNCGFSATPTGPPSPILLAPAGARGADLDQHLCRIGSALPLDVADLMGHNTLRRAVLGGSRTATAAEVDRMAAMLDDFLARGGAGMSVGLNFPETIGVDSKELLPLCRVLGKYERPLTCHLRNQGEGLLEAVEEVARLGDDAACPVLLSHLRPVPSRFDPLLEGVLQRVDRRPSLHMDVYPYVAGCTTLEFFFHNSLGGVPRRGQLLAPDSVTEKTLAWFPRGFDDIQVMRHRNQRWVGKSVEEIASAEGEASGLNIQRILLEDPECLCIYQNTSTPAAVERVLLHPKCFVGSDGYLFSSAYRDVCHPRSFASFTGFLVRFVRSGKLSLEEALAKLTRRPARFFNLKDRGEIRTGRKATFCLFRLEALEERATFDRPWEPSAGMTEVVVAGRTAWSEGTLKARAGRRATPDPY
jgi:N-acyl-D-aspartate/D-glutamate deacylase